MAQPDVLYVDAEEGQPFTMDSLCMECMQNVSVIPSSLDAALQHWLDE